MFKKDVKETKDLMSKSKNPKIKTDHMTEIGAVDMDDLCQATESAIKSGGGFGWLKMPSRDVLERFWKGVILVPHRDLFVGRVDGSIAGTVQLIRQPSNNEAQKFSAKIISVFVSPWARGFGVGEKMIKEVEKFAKKKGIEVIRLDVRETQKEAIRLFEKCGYQQWGTNPHYAKVKGKVVHGFYFQKLLKGKTSKSVKK